MSGNISDDKSDEEESISNDFTLYYENICCVVSSLLSKREEYINTDYTVNGWILCVITCIREDVFKNSQKKECYQNFVCWIK